MAGESRAEGGGVKRGGRWQEINYYQKHSTKFLVGKLIDCCQDRHQPNKKRFGKKNEKENHHFFFFFLVRGKKKNKSVFFCSPTLSKAKSRQVSRQADG